MVKNTTPKNVRMRGKINRAEWPKIADRFAKGETLTEIARSYQCTAPAIRYIVSRVSSGAGEGGLQRENPENIAAPAPDRDHDGRRSAESPTAETWDRISSDIASFLARMDAVSANESDENYQALLLATDRLLRASARTRLELERVLNGRKTGGRKKGIT